MTPEEIKEIQRQSFERLGKGLDHGVQFRYQKKGEWQTAPTQSNGSACCTFADTNEYRIRPETVNVFGKELPLGKFTPKEIDRDDLIEIIMRSWNTRADDMGSFWGGIADQIIEHLNAKPRENFGYDLSASESVTSEVTVRVEPAEPTESIIERCAQEADHWQHITDTNPLRKDKCKCGDYIAAAIRGLGETPTEPRS